MTSWLELREMPVVTVEQIVRFREAVFAGIAQLERENAALLADARRYRYITAGLRGQDMLSTMTDANIDAAINAAEIGKKE